MVSLLQQFKSAQSGIANQAARIIRYITFKQNLSKRFVKPLVQIADYPARITDFSHNALGVWMDSNAYKKTSLFFDNYPDNSLVSSTSRKFLYHITRSLRPQHVAEVGTYYAASSEAITRALWENRNGILHTTDPYGKRRCPAIISRWPHDLQKHVRFYPLNSMSFFEKLENHGIMLDLVFIDGNHDYEYASFDLTYAAKLIRPNGIIILDNIAQPGPFWAGLEFLKANPAWREISSLISTFNEAQPFDMSRSLIADVSFMVLQAPDYLPLQAAPHSTGQRQYSGSPFQSLRLEFVEPSSKGILHAQIFLRYFIKGYDPQQSKVVTKLELDSQTSAVMKLPALIGLSDWQAGSGNSCTLEIILFWQPEKVGDCLKLKSSPEPVSLSGTAANK